MARITGDRQRPFVKDGEPEEGDFAGHALKGALLVDSDAGALYVNTGTQGEPEWTKIAPAEEGGGE